jgi:hypothetical protein
MKKTFIFLLFLALAKSYGNSQTIVKLLLPDNCSTNQTIIKDLKNNNGSKLELFPNPNDGSFSLNVSFKSQIDKANISIYNSMGKIVFNEIIFCNSEKFIKQLHLQNLTAGIYLTIVKNAKQQVSSELIIK